MQNGQKKIYKAYCASNKAVYMEYVNVVFWLNAPHNRNSFDDKIARKNCGPPIP